MCTSTKQDGSLLYRLKEHKAGVKFTKTNVSAVAQHAWKKQNQMDFQSIYHCPNPREGHAPTLVSRNSTHTNAKLYKQGNWNACPSLQMLVLILFFFCCLVVLYVFHWYFHAQTDNTWPFFPPLHNPYKFISVFRLLSVVCVGVL